MIGIIIYHKHARRNSCPGEQVFQTFQQDFALIVGYDDSDERFGHRKKVGSPESLPNLFDAGFRTE